MIMEWILALKANAGWIVSAVLFAVFTLYLIRDGKKIEARRLHERNTYLKQTLTHHGIGEVQTLKDSTINGGPSGDGHKPWQVHLILHSPPDRWFLYLHIEGSPPVLSPLSEQRALLAVNA